MILHAVVKKGNKQDINDLYAAYEVLYFFAYHHRLDRYELNILDDNVDTIRKLNTMFENMFTYLSTPKLKIQLDGKLTHIGDAPYRFRPGEIRLMQEALNYDSGDLLTLLPQPMGYTAFCDIVKNSEPPPTWLTKLQDTLHLRSESEQDLDVARLILVQKEALNILDLLDPKGVVISSSKRFALDLNEQRHRFPLKSRASKFETN